MGTMDYTYAERQRDVNAGLYMDFPLETLVGDRVDELFADFVVVNADIDVAAEDTNVVAVDIQVVDSDGEDLENVYALEVFITDDEAGETLAVTAPDGGVAVASEGEGAVLVALTANKHLQCITGSTGLLNLEITETGDDVFYVGVRLPNGKYVVSDACTFATS